MDLLIAEEVAKQATEYIRKLLDKIKELEAENKRLRVESCENRKSLHS